MRRLRLASVGLLFAPALACNTGVNVKEMQPEPPIATAATPAPTPSPVPAPSPAPAAQRFGAPFDDKARRIALAEVAKTPDAYVGKTFATTGTVTAVCQHMGCWMEIKDDAGEAHLKMAGHAFFIPKTASGRKARVMATLLKSPEAEPACGDGSGQGHGGKGCKAEAEAQLGRPLAKLELVAQGVELL